MWLEPLLQTFLVTAFLISATILEKSIIGDQCFETSMGLLPPRDLRSGEVPARGAELPQSLHVGSKTVNFLIRCIFAVFSLILVSRRGFGAFF